MTVTLPDIEAFDFPAVEGEAGWVALADQLLRRLLDTQQERAANAAAEKAELERIHAAYTDLDGPLARREAMLTEHLERCALALKPFFRGKKSRSLAFGRIGWKEAAGRLDVADPEAALAWAKRHAPQAVEEVTKERLVKKVLDATVLTTGEVPEGCTWIPGGDRFYARPGASAPDTE